MYAVLCCKHYYFVGRHQLVMSNEQRAVRSYSVCLGDLEPYEGPVCVKPTDESDLDDSSDKKDHKPKQAEQKKLETFLRQRRSFAIPR